MTQLS